MYPEDRLVEQRMSNIRNVHHQVNQQYMDLQTDAVNNNMATYNELVSEISSY